MLIGIDVDSCLPICAIPVDVCWKEGLFVYVDDIVMNMFALN